MIPENLFDTKMYPPANRFMVTFTSAHLLVDGKSHCYQNQRRVCLADNTNDAREFFRLGELANKNTWDGHFHSWKNLQVQPVPTATPWVGYCRFHNDCRKSIKTS